MVQPLQVGVKIKEFQLQIKDRKN